MIKTELIDGKIVSSIELPKGLSKKHLLNFKSLMTNNNLTYLVQYNKSFKNTRINAQRIPFNKPYKIVGVRDTLAEKKPNKYWNMIMKQFDPLAHDTPRPSTEDNNYIGVEIECKLPKIRGVDMSDKEMTYNALAERFKKLRIKNVRIKDDGSVTNTDRWASCEVVVLTKSDDLSNLEQVCSVLSEVGATVDTSCGLHIHLDSRDGKGNSRANKLLKVMPILKAMMPKSRLNNRFCQNDVSSGRRSGSRYAKINKTAINKYGTLEIRMHSGTTSFVKISNWISILTTVANSKKRFPLVQEEKDLISVAGKLNWSPELYSYVVNRINKFSNPELNEFVNEREVA